MKFRASLVNPEDVLDGQTPNLYGGPPGVVYNIAEWVDLGDIEVSIPDRETLTRHALANLDKMDKAARVTLERELARVEERRKKLLAITYNGDSDANI